MLRARRRYYATHGVCLQVDTVPESLREVMLVFQHVFRSVTQQILSFSWARKDMVAALENKAESTV
jgi:hypothetical protein